MDLLTGAGVILLIILVIAVSTIRIAREYIAKHAGASHAFVHLSATDGSVDFKVQDDGVGFDPARTPAGSGLTNMTDRTDALGGTLELTSIVGEGTRVKGSLPIALPAAPTNQAGS